MTDYGRAGQGFMGILRTSPFAVCLEQGSEHAKPFGIGDGFQQSLSQLLLATVFRQQQHIKASVRRR